MKYFNSFTTGFLPLQCLLLVSCFDAQSNKADNQNRNLDEKRQVLEIVEEPYGQNKEWVEYRKFIGMYALHLKPSHNLKTRMYELKYEYFSDGKKSGALVFGQDRLGTIGNSLYNDSLLHFYAFPLSDTAFRFVYNAMPGYTNSIHLPLLKDIKETFKWIHLSTGSSFELKDTVWQPIFALTQPYVETCTPDKCYYCVLPDNASHYQDWGKTMGIKQYFIFSIRLL